MAIARPSEQFNEAVKKLREEGYRDLMTQEWMQYGSMGALSYLAKDDPDGNLETVVSISQLTGEISRVYPAP